MNKDKKLSIPAMAVKNLKAKKFRTIFMMFFVFLMSATLFFSTILMKNLEMIYIHQLNAVYLHMVCHLRNMRLDK